MPFARTGFAASICLVILFVVGLKIGDPPGKQIQTFADSFLVSLSDEQAKQATLPYDSEQRVDWHFIPKKSRKGLALRDMNTAQRTAALRLLRAALSEAGYDKASKIMLLEGVLRELGADKKFERDPQKYFVTLFGRPSETEPWAFSFEGHHLSLNFSFRDGKVSDSTPQFLATNPGEIMDDVSGPLGKGTRVLREEEDRGFKLINALSEENRKAAMIAEEAPDELRFAGEAQVDVGEPEGVAYSKLSKDNQKLLRRIVFVYTNAVPDDLAAQRRDLIKKDGWANIHFAWAGATKPGIGHYYRVRGNSFLIEFVNTQADASGNPANHVHAVWRDVTGDFDLPNE